MHTSRISAKHSLLIFGDLLSFGLGILFGILSRYGGFPETHLIRLYQFATPFLVFLWFLVFIAFGLYDLSFAKNSPRFFERLARAVATSFVCTALAFYFIPDFFSLRPLVTLVVIFGFLSFFTFLWRVLFNGFLSRVAHERVLFFGVTDEVIELIRFLTENPQLGSVPILCIQNHHPTGDIAIPLRCPLPLVTVSESEQDLPRIVREHAIDHVVIAHTVKRTKTLLRSLFTILPLGIPITDLPRFYEYVAGKVPTSLITETWFLENLVGQRRPRYDRAKRILDLVLACLFGCIGVILLPFIASAIFLSTPKDILRHRTRRARPGDGIIFFRQERMGQNGRTFDFLKFRSQILGAERMGGEKQHRERTRDPRAYPVGTFLRKTYLDELAQLWNVIRGEMSFVGPRPERPEFVRELEQRIPFYRMRELVLPGITGWAQINMENDASVSDAPVKMQYDLYYIKNRSIALDILIVLRTALKLFQRSGR